MTTKCQCGTHPPAKPKAVELAKLEAILADCRARKAKAAPGKPMPLIACLADKAADLRKSSTRQASAELDRLKAENATLKAKIAATSKPAPAKPAGPSASILEAFHAMTGPAAAAFYAAHGPAIRAELANRNHDRAVIENEMKVARAAGKNLAELKKR